MGVGRELQLVGMEELQALKEGRILSLEAGKGCSTGNTTHVHSFPLSKQGGLVQKAIIRSTNIY